MSHPAAVSRAVATLALLLASCAGKDVIYEGDDPSECADGADNDRDGYFDCNDNGCWGAPSCEGVQDTAPPVDSASDTDTDTDTDSDTDSDSDSDTDTDTDSDSDTDTDTDTDTGGVSSLSELTSFSLSYSLEWDFDDTYEDVIAGWGLADCTTVYRSQGDQVAVDGDIVTFQGTWAIGETDCGETQTDPTIVWYDTSGEAYTSFDFLDDELTLYAWVEHKRSQDTEPLEGASSRNQWYISEIYEEIDLSSLRISHFESETSSLEGLIPYTLNHSVEVQFNP